MDDLLEVSGMCNITLVNGVFTKEVDCIIRNTYGQPILLKTIDGDKYNWNFIVSIERKTNG